MINAEKMIDMFGNEGNGPTIRLGKIDPNYTTGKPAVVFDTASGVVSVKKYPFISSYSPKPNDRVILINNVIIGRVANDGVTDAGGSVGSHNHDDRYPLLSHQHDYLVVTDTRTVVPSPSDYGWINKMEFKSNEILGLESGLGWSGVMTIAPWGDDSGGGVHQMAFSESGKIYQRYGKRADGWGIWREIPTLSKYVDANGWTVYDNGSVKEYKKQISFTANGNNSGGSWAYQNENLPSGMSNLQNVFYDMTYVGGGYSSLISVVPEIGPDSTVLNVTYSSTSTVTVGVVTTWTLKTK